MYYFAGGRQSVNGGVIVKRAAARERPCDRPHDTPREREKRRCRRMKKPNYVEPAIGWNDEDFHTGVTKFGVANYEGTAKLKVMAPAHRPALMPPPQTEAMEVEPQLLLM